MRGIGMICATIAALLTIAGVARAQAPDRPEACPKLIAFGAPRIVPATLNDDQLALAFVGHATFLLETPAGVRIATDYNDYVRPSVLPDVITMNRAHSTHYTDRPNPAIGTVLRGWNPRGGGTDIDVTVKDVRIRNVVTNIRDWSGGTDYDGNSIFVFEAAGLCVAHLGHLHHELTPEHLRQLGRIDVVLVPVDGSYTLDMAGMMDVLRAIEAPLIIPMHFFGPSTLERFLRIAGERWPVERSSSASVVLSRAMLPAKPKVLVLPGR